MGRYELVESWSQTLDFSKKKKGTQCDAIEIEAADTQVRAHSSTYLIHSVSFIWDTVSNCTYINLACANIF